ncbi:hypothetical protein GYB59_22065 [bacterium]|nr:hypothetical protein [bacterium]
MADQEKQETQQPPKIDGSKPAFQPAGYDANSNTHTFESSEVMWWDNGVWGKCGYGIPNDGGKPTTPNETINHIHDFIGAELFNLMHRDDIKFSRPFNADWLYDLNKMLVLGIKRLGDLSVGFTGKRKGDSDHTSNTPKPFTIYPIPHFGQRVRQKDALRWSGQLLIVLSEIMQHSDNDYDDDITDLFAGMVSAKLLRIQQDMAMKYLGYTAEQVNAPGFTVPLDSFNAESYKPADLFTSRELIEERAPEQWWPSTNDLTPIKGIPANVAKVYGKRWPYAEGFYGDGGAKESAFPGGGAVGTTVQIPGARPA